MARINHFLAALKEHLHLEKGKRQKCYERELGRSIREKDEGGQFLILTVGKLLKMIW